MRRPVHSIQRQQSNRRRATDGSIDERIRRARVAHAEYIEEVAAEREMRDRVRRDARVRTDLNGR